MQIFLFTKIITKIYLRLSNLFQQLPDLNNKSRKVGHKQVFSVPYVLLTWLQYIWNVLHVMNTSNNFKRQGENAGCGDRSNESQSTTKSAARVRLVLVIQLYTFVSIM